MENSDWFSSISLPTLQSRSLAAAPAPPPGCASVFAMTERTSFVGNLAASAVSAGKYLCDCEYSQGYCQTCENRHDIEFDYALVKMRMNRKKNTKQN